MTKTNSAKVPRPSDNESQVLLAIDAKRKLQTTIDALESKRKEAEIDFAKTFVKDTRAKSIDVEAAFKANEAWRTKDERSKQRIEALQSILERVNKHI